MTGGVGMGKSACAEFLRRLGVPVVDTDIVAREVVAPGEPALREIHERFGHEVLLPDGRLDRAALGRRVFDDPDARRALEGIVHPRIRTRWLRALVEWREEGRPMGAVIIPLLYETGAERELDVVVCVACTAATQRTRLRERGWTEEHARRRVEAQMPIEQKMLRADFVVWTEPPLAEHEAQVRRILAVLASGSGPRRS